MGKHSQVPQLQWHSYIGQGRKVLEHIEGGNITQRQKYTAQTDRGDFVTVHMHMQATCNWWVHYTLPSLIACRGSR